MEKKKKILVAPNDATSLSESRIPTRCYPRDFKIVYRFPPGGRYFLRGVWSRERVNPKKSDSSNTPAISTAARITFKDTFIVHLSKFLRVLRIILPKYSFHQHLTFSLARLRCPDVETKRKKNFSTFSDIFV